MFLLKQTLPDQMHCYFLTDLPDSKAVMVDSIPFTHPACVKDILAILRRQAAFNTVVESCVRVNSIQGKQAICHNLTLNY